MTASLEAPGPIADVASVVPTQHPGRWLGGLIGALIPGLVAVAAMALGEQPDLTVDGMLEFAGVVSVSMAGMPIGFLVGRWLLPFARSGGWRQAIWAGAVAGLSAPPLGAIGVLLIAALTESFAATSAPWAPVQYLVLTPLAVVVGYAAAVVTLPVGIVWGLLVRAVPATWLERARVPSPLDRLGARHVLMALAVALAGANLVRSIVGPGG